MSQHAQASIPGWMEWVIDKMYPTWRAVSATAEGLAGTVRPDWRAAIGGAGAGISAARGRLLKMAVV